MTSSELEQEIRSVRASQETLEREAATARTSLDALLREAKTDVDAIASVQSRVTALEQAIHTRERTLHELTVALKQAQAGEQRESILTRLAEIAGEATRELAEIEKDRAKANSHLTRLIERICEGYSRERQLRTEFMALADSIAPILRVRAYGAEERDPAVAMGIQELIRDLTARGVDLSAVRAPWSGVFEETTIDQTLTLTVLEPHGGAVNVAVSAIENRRMEEAARQRAARQAPAARSA